MEELVLNHWTIETTSLTRPIASCDWAADSLAYCGARGVSYTAREPGKTRSATTPQPTTLSAVYINTRVM